MKEKLEEAIKVCADLAARAAESDHLRLRQMKKKFHVPLYDAVVWVVVCDDIAKERKKWENLFGPVQADEMYDALCSHSGGQTFGLFFERKIITLKIVAHETFHLTHRILDWVGGNFDKTHHEQAALLHGFLMPTILKTIGRVKLQ